MTKFVVFELKYDEDLAEVVKFMAAKTTRLAVVDSVPGVFFPYPSTPAADTFPKVTSGELEPELALEVADASTKPHLVNPVSTLLNSPLPGLDQSFSAAGPSGEIQKPVEDSKENIQMQMAVDAILNGEDADLMDTPETPDYQTMSKKRRRRMMQREDYDLGSSGSRKKTRCTEETLYCGLCKSSMTLRASYGRTRLREHVLRHLNMVTAKCGLCGFTGVLREHIRRHHSIKHPNDKMCCVDLVMDDEFDERFETLWKTCFPDTRAIPARSNAKRLAEGPLDERMDSDASTSGLALASKSIAESMEEILRQAENGGLNPDFSMFQFNNQEQPSEEDDIKPDLELLKRRTQVHRVTTS